MIDRYRAMCAELLLFSEEAGEICMMESLWPKSDPNCTLLDRARALLAQTESKGPSLKEQALEAISRLRASVIHDDLWDDATIVRRALEALDD